MSPAPTPTPICPECNNTGWQRLISAANAHGACECGIKPTDMHPTPTPETEEVLRRNACSEQSPAEDYDVLADHAAKMERELAEAKQQAGRLAGALERTLDRMDRARNILTDGRPRPECNWGMLDSTELRKELAAWREGRNDDTPRA